MIFVFDLDGTISFDGKSISLELLESLTELSLKNQLIFASARPIRDVTTFISLSKRAVDRWEWLNCQK
ncbi:HAD hydrolase family protein [Lactococcus cremoris]